MVWSLFVPEGQLQRNEALLTLILQPLTSRFLFIARQPLGTLELRCVFALYVGCADGIFLFGILDAQIAIDLSLHMVFSIQGFSGIPSCFIPTRRFAK